MLGVRRMKTLADLKAMVSHKDSIILVLLQVLKIALQHTKVLGFQVLCTMQILTICRCRKTHLHCNEKMEI